MSCSLKLVEPIVIAGFGTRPRSLKKLVGEQAVPASSASAAVNQPRRRTSFADSLTHRSVQDEFHDVDAQVGGVEHAIDAGAGALILDAAGAPFDRIGRLGPAAIDIDPLDDYVGILGRELASLDQPPVAVRLLSHRTA